MLKIDRDNGDHRDELIKKKKTETQAGLCAAVIIRDIIAVINEQAALVSEGRTLVAEIDDLPVKQQVGVIINMLNTELESSTDRLEDLIACFSGA